MKHYASGAVIETRITTKTVPGTVKVCRDGVEVTPGWSVDTTTGLATFSTAPAVGVQITVDFAFDVPVRFASDQMEVTIETFELGPWGPIPVVELRP